MFWTGAALAGFSVLGIHPTILTKSGPVFSFFFGGGGISPKYGFVPLALTASSFYLPITYIGLICINIIYLYLTGVQIYYI